MKVLSNPGSNDPIQKVADHYSRYFAGTPEIRTIHFPFQPHRTVECCVTKHDDGVSYFGTLGCSMLDNGKNGPMSPTGQPIRIEMISAAKEEFENALIALLGNVVGILETFEGGFSPGMILRDVIPEGFTMKHVYLCDPFLWDEGLPSLDAGDHIVAFVYALPIAEDERLFATKQSVIEFENQLEKKRVPYFDLNRKSIFASA